MRSKHLIIQFFDVIEKLRTLQVSISVNGKCCSMVSLLKLNKCINGRFKGLFK